MTDGREGLATGEGWMLMGGCLGGGGASQTLETLNWEVSIAFWAHSQTPRLPR